MNRSRLAVFACLLPILAASMSRVAATFALYTTEVDGWLAAVGIDGMVAILMWRIMDGERKAAHRWAVAGVLLASAVSAQANLAAAAATPAGRAALAAGGWPLSILATVSVTLPVLVGILAAVAHGDAKAEPVKRERARKADVPAIPDPLPGMWTTYGPRPAPVRTSKSAVRATASATAEAARAIAAAEPGIARVEIARRLQVHPSQVTRALGAAATAERNGQHASAGEVGG